MLIGMNGIKREPRIPSQLGLGPALGFLWPKRCTLPVVRGREKTIYIAVVRELWFEAASVPALDFQTELSVSAPTAVEISVLLDFEELINMLEILSQLLSRWLCF